MKATHSLVAGSMTTTAGAANICCLATEMGLGWSCAARRASAFGPVLPMQPCGGILARSVVSYHGSLMKYATMAMSACACTAFLAGKPAQPIEIMAGSVSTDQFSKMAAAALV